jgi:hypothetical protein
MAARGVLPIAVAGKEFAAMSGEYPHFRSTHEAAGDPG